MDGSTRFSLSRRAKVGEICGIQNGERNTKTRGRSKFVRISWDEATDLIAAEIKRLHDFYGPHSIYCQGEGHGEAKNYGGSHGCQIQLLKLVGGCTVQARNADSWEGWYWGAKWIWGMDPMGENVYQNGVFKDITENGDAVLFWGCDCETTSWGWGGQLPSRMCYWFTDIGIRQIHIAPDVNYTNAANADKWLPVIPNTDAALQLAIAYVWITEDLYDKDYIAGHADGFDWFVYHVMGGDDSTPKTPKWAKEKCGIRAWTIKALARYWASHAVSIAHCNGGGYIRSAFSHEPARLEVALLGMQGMGRPGANQFQFIEWTLFNLPSKSPVPVSEVYPTAEAVYHGFDMMTGPSFIPKTLLPKAILNPPVKWYGHTMAGYPKEDQLQEFSFPLVGDAGVRAIWSDAPCWSTCWNGGFEFEEALRSEQVETIIMQHPWMENDTLFADIILPTATFMECPDLTTDNYNGQHSMLIYEEQAVDAVGEAKSEFDTCCAVAAKLEKLGGAYEGLLKRYTANNDFETLAAKGFAASGVNDISFEQLKKQRFWCSPVRDGWQDEIAGMANFHDNPESFPLDTPTGNIEHGDVVKIFNERGTVLGGAYVTERIRPGVLYQDHGARIDAIVGGRAGLDRGGANNLICTPETTSPNCVGEVTNSFLVGVAKVDPFELAQQYPEEFARNYDPATGVIPEAYLVGTEGGA
jgi:trimethylamine-N-oxide reductase (cytochrome c)